MNNFAKRSGNLIIVQLHRVAKGQFRNAKSWSFPIYLFEIDVIIM